MILVILEELVIVLDKCISILIETSGTVAVWPENPFFLLLTRIQGPQGTVRWKLKYPAVLQFLGLSLIVNLFFFFLIQIF